MSNALALHILSLVAHHHKPTVLLGLSGGADSVFLFRHLAPLHHEGKLLLHALHVNHGWRESAAHDAAFCEALCKQHAIPFIGEQLKEWREKIPTHKQNSGSREADAREGRRIIFQFHQQALNAHFIALAHHADDQIETFFIRLIRGAGLSGLCSMRPLQNTIVRPLLSTFKAEILQWLVEHQQPFCYDETNDDPAFLRNRIRSLLIPTLSACDSRSALSMLRCIANLQQEEEALVLACDQALESLRITEASYSIPQFFVYPTALRVRILTLLLIQTGKPFSPSEALFAEIERFLKSPRGGRHRLNEHIMLSKQRRTFHFGEATT